MMYFVFILQFIWFIVFVVSFFNKGNVLLLVAAAIIPLNTLATYFYYKKKNREITDKNSNKEQEN